MNSTNWIRFSNFFPKNKRASSAPFSRGAAKESVAPGGFCSPLIKGGWGGFFSAPGRRGRRRFFSPYQGRPGQILLPLSREAGRILLPPYQGWLGGILFPPHQADRRRKASLPGPLLPPYQGGLGGIPTCLPGCRCPQACWTIYILPAWCQFPPAQPGRSPRSNSTLFRMICAPSRLICERWGCT